MKHIIRIFYVLILIGILCGGCRGVDFYSMRFKNGMAQQGTGKDGIDDTLIALNWLRKHGYIKTGIPVSQVRALLGTDIVQQHPEDPTDERYIYGIAPGTNLGIYIENGIVVSIGIEHEEGYEANE